MLESLEPLQNAIAVVFTQIRFEKVQDTSDVTVSMGAVCRGYSTSQTTSSQLHYVQMFTHTSRSETYG